jgi:molybdopterin synthase catalytic subunit
MAISIQKETFDAGAITNSLVDSASGYSGALVTMTGVVKSKTATHQTLRALELECYPDMARKIISDIEQQARHRWDLHHTTIIHRYGLLSPSDVIVLVAVMAEGRKAAFSAAMYIMDLVKTEAPFWKNEHTENGEHHWISVNKTDSDASSTWLHPVSCTITSSKKL